MYKRCLCTFQSLDCPNNPFYRWEDWASKMQWFDSKMHTELWPRFNSIPEFLLILGLNNPNCGERDKEQNGKLNQIYKWLDELEEYLLYCFLFLNQVDSFSQRTLPAPSFLTKNRAYFVRWPWLQRGGQDEVLRLLGIVVEQAVDIRQGADRGKPSRDWRSAGEKTRAHEWTQQRVVSKMTLLSNSLAQLNDWCIHACIQ